MIRSVFALAKFSPSVAIRQAERKHLLAVIPNLRLLRLPPVAREPSAECVDILGDLGEIASSR